MNSKVKSFIQYIVFLIFLFETTHVFCQPVYDSGPTNPEAVYCTSENSGVRSNGKSDASGSLQSAINQLKRTKYLRILFIPKGNT